MTDFLFIFALLKVLGFYAVFTLATTLLGGYLADTLMWNSISYANTCTRDMSYSETLSTANYS